MADMEWITEIWKHIRTFCADGGADPQDPRGAGYPGEYRDYFMRAVPFLLKTAEIFEKQQNGTLAKRTLAECQADQDDLYRHLRPEHYGSSYANPAYAVKMLGQEAGQLLTLLCSELEGCIAWAFQGADSGADTSV